MFSENQKEHSLLVSMDDKAYLRPGTDVGARNTKAGVIYNVCDPNEQKQLPKHDFNVPQVNQTPASFRCIKKHIETIQGKDELISDQDQSLVIIRPKYYIGSSGSVWASDYMRLCYEVPQLFQENSENTGLSKEMQKLVIRSHDVVYYFTDLTMEEDTMRVTAERTVSTTAMNRKNSFGFKIKLAISQSNTKRLPTWNLRKKSEVNYWKTSLKFCKRQHQCKRKCYRMFDKESYGRKLSTS